MGERHDAKDLSFNHFHSRRRSRYSVSRRARAGCKLYGMTSSPEVVLMARFFGGALVAWGAILWSTKSFSEGGAVRAVLLSTAVAEAIGVVTAVMGTVAGTLNAMGWLAVAIYAFGTVGCVYFLMGQKQLVTA